MSLSIQSIYDIEGIVTGAVKSVLESKNLKVVTSREAPEFQSARPRVELWWATGAAMRRPLVSVSGSSDIQPETSWAGTLEFHIISTVSSSNVLNSNGAILSIIRWQLVWLESKVNEVLMPNHRLYILGEQGSTPTFRVEQDIEKSVLSVACHVSIQTDALAATLAQFPS